MKTDDPHARRGVRHGEGPDRDRHPGAAQLGARPRRASPAAKAAVAGTARRRRADDDGGSGGGAARRRLGSRAGGRLGGSGARRRLGPRTGGRRRAVRRVGRGTGAPSSAAAPAATRPARPPPRRRHRRRADAEPRPQRFEAAARADGGRVHARSGARATAPLEGGLTSQLPPMPTGLRPAAGRQAPRRGRGGDRGRPQRVVHAERVGRPPGRGAAAASRASSGSAARGCRDLERSGPRTLRSLWGAARDDLQARYGDVTIGVLLDAYEKGGDAGSPGRDRPESGRSRDPDPHDEERGLAAALFVMLRCLATAQRSIFRATCWAGSARGVRPRPLRSRRSTRLTYTRRSPGRTRTPAESDRGQAGAERLVAEARDVAGEVAVPASPSALLLAEGAGCIAAAGGARRPVAASAVALVLTDDPTAIQQSSASVRTRLSRTLPDRRVHDAGQGQGLGVRVERLARASPIGDQGRTT